MSTTFLDIPIEVWLSHFPQVLSSGYPEEAFSPELERTVANLSVTCATASKIFTPILYSQLYCHVSQNSTSTIRRLFLILRTLCNSPRLGLYVRRLSLSLNARELEIENGLAVTEPNEGKEVLDLVLDGLPGDRNVLRHLWNVQKEATDDGESSVLHPHRIHIVAQLLLSPLKHLRHLHSAEPFNIAMVSILCPTLTSISCLLPAAPTLEALLQSQRLREMWFYTNNNYPLQLLEIMPARQFTCEHLSIILMADGDDSPVFELAVATELVKKFKSIETLHLTLWHPSGELLTFISSIPKSLKALYLYMGSSVPDCFGTRHQRTCLKRFANLEYLEMPPELLLGYEPCKHNKDSSPLSSPTLHPSTLVEELLPQSLKYLSFIVDKHHISRNGDDYFIQILLTLVWHRQLLPDLRAITLYEGPQIRDCFICEDWYGIGGRDAADSGSAVLSYELTRFEKLCMVRGVFFSSTPGILLPEVPTTCEGRGLSLHRATKINSRRSWQDCSDGDVSLFELFNTACLTVARNQPVNDTKLAHYLLLPA